MTRINPELKPVEAAEIQARIQDNDGYCLCALVKDEDTKCMCTEFRNMKEGICGCGLYEKILEK